MKALIPFLLSGAAGLAFRTVLSALAGTAYTTNGRDIYNAAVCLLMCYYAREILECIRERRAQERHADRLETVTTDHTDNKAA